MTFRSPIFELADQHVEALALISPIQCTMMGNGINQDKWDDFSLEGSNVSAELVRRDLAKLRTLEPIDEIDRIAKKVMEERLESSLLLHDSGEEHLIWSVLTSPVSDLRSVFEIMSHESAEDIANVSARLKALDLAFTQWASKLSTLASQGKTTARRQVEGVIDQLGQHANLHDNDDQKQLTQHLQKHYLKKASALHE